MSKPIIFFGTESYSCLVLQQLVEAGLEITAVVTKPDIKSGRGQKTSPPKVKEIADSAGIAVWQPNSLDDIRDKITESKCDWAVLVAYGRIIPQRILDLFSGGIINIHPSLLPTWRGPSPVESCILAGDTKTGVSIMKLTAKMDAGPIYLQKEIELNGNESKVELYNQLFTLGGQLLIDSFEKIFSGNLQPKVQDENKATYSKLIRKEDGRLDFLNKTADELDREIRAYQGWPGSYTKLGRLDVIITSATLVPTNYRPGYVDVIAEKDTRVILIYCKEGCLDIDKLLPVGKTEMRTWDFIAGYKSKLTDN